MPKPKLVVKDVLSGPLEAPATGEYSPRRLSIRTPVVEEIPRSGNDMCA